GVSWCKFLNGSNRIYYFINYTKMPQELVIEVASSTVPELWDTFTGEISTAPILQSATAGKELQYTIKIDLPCNYGVFLIAN
ncbi:MAG: hypothetical protein K0S04_2622, partial [Herbinix sp.]|nr:hypothetical protein [Herbinix sp.]